MLSLEEARARIAAHVVPTGLAEIPLSEAHGRVLGESVLAGSYFPSGDRGTMDGYVIRGDEAPGYFRVTGEIQAGDVPERALEKGEAQRIFTGALVPEAGGRVVPQELATREGDVVRLGEFPEALFIRRKGSEAKPEDVVLPAGTRLGGAELAILAQIGHVRPKVVIQPVIHHLATGSELVAPEQIPGRGEIRDSNSSLLAGLLADLGTPVSGSWRVADEPERISEFADGEQDLLLVSGGASVGDYDFGKAVLERLGYTIHFDKLNLRPGKPLVFATRGQQVAFVIPGNPVSHFVTFHVAIRLALELLTGRAPRWDFQQIELPDAGMLKQDPRDTFWPARVSPEAGRLVVRPKNWLSSGDSFSLAGANALVRVNEHSPDGNLASVLLLDVPADTSSPAPSPILSPAQA